MFKITKKIVDSEGNGSYVIITGNDVGVVAVRRCWNGYRVIVEPSGPDAAASLAKVLHRNIFVDPSWKQPGDGDKFFKVEVESAQALQDVVAEAVAALQLSGPVEGNWLGALAAVADVGAHS